MKKTTFERDPPPAAQVDAALAGSAHRPYWLDQFAPVVRATMSPGMRADLVIVGGGFLGLWTALQAKERDPSRSVLLLDAGKVGGAASGRNGGFCEASITHGEDNGRQRWPDEYAQLEQLGLANLAGFEDALRRYGIDCDYEKTGSLVVATEPYQVEKLQGHGFLDQQQVRAELASPTYLAGAWHRDDSALLHPGKLAAGLARVIHGLGVRIGEGIKVERLRDTGAGIVLETSSGPITGTRVILATNAFPALLARWRLHTIPVYDYVLMTEPLSAPQLDAIGWQHRQGVSDLGNQFHYYRLTADNRILFGGYDAVYHYGRKIAPALEERPASYRRLASHFFTTFPQLAGVRFSHRWAGVIDTSTRFAAFFGRAYGDRVLHAAGFTGLGVGATRFAANVLLDLAEQRDTELTRLRMVRGMPVPFPPEPFTYAAVRATQWSLDRADHNDGKRNLLLRLQSAVGLGFDS